MNSVCSFRWLCAELLALAWTRDGLHIKANALRIFGAVQDEEEHSLDLRGSRGVLLTGCLMLYMAACNFRNTVATILAKQRVKLQRRAGKTPTASPEKKP